MNFRNLLRKIGFKGSFALIYWLLLFVGFLIAIILPSLATCTGSVLTLCFSYGVILMAIVTFPGIALLQILGLNANLTPALIAPLSIAFATVLYFCIGLIIDILRKRKS